MIIIMAYIIELSDRDSLLNFRVKEKRQIIDIWLEISLKLLSNMYKVSNEEVPSLKKSELVYLVEKNDFWKIYIIDKYLPDHKKIVIMSFPFSISSEFGSILLKYKNKDVGAREISMIKSVLKYMYDETKNLTLYDSIIEVLYDMELNDDEEEIVLNDMVVELLSFSEGYIRYDYDPENELGEIHPLYHLDIFFSNQSTFKIGLPRRYEIKDLLDLLDYEKPCRYLNQ